MRLLSLINQTMTRFSYIVMNNENNDNRTYSPWSPDLVGHTIFVLN